MLGGLFVTPTVTAIVEALASARAEGPIAVVGHGRIAAALAAVREVTPVGLSPRAAKKLAGAVADTSGIADGSLAAVVGMAIAGDEAWAATLAAWSRTVRDGGAIVFVDRGYAPEASRRALCAGLSELEQRRAGRAVITSGLVTHL
ncbi:MAG: hypothetical protein KF773_39200 [Deltaproteobacteria bacterium]|nr:hypothetical protein [Deltaproteobacteria bacterium]MCW5805877.1 hypothetical protein [Deltaproteobacteria bacterium]